MPSVRRLCILILFLAIFAVLCPLVAQKNGKAPEWFSQLDASYPREQYLAQKGEGKSIELARSDALARMASIFNLNISSQSKAKQSYDSQSNQYNYSVEENDNIEFGSTIYFVEYSSVYSAGKRYYIVAYINKSFAIQQAELRVKRNLRVIKKLEAELATASARTRAASLQQLVTSSGETQSYLDYMLVLGYDVEKGLDLSDQLKTALYQKELAVYLQNSVYRKLDEYKTNYHYPLHQAIRDNQLELVKLLLEEGVSPNQESENGELPLVLVASLSSSTESIDFAKELLAKGANINQKIQNATDWAGNTILHQILAKYPEAHDYIRFLTKNGADVNVRYQSAANAYSNINSLLFVNNMNARNVDTLLDAGIDPYRNRNASFPQDFFHYVVALGNIEIIDVLLAHKVKLEPTLLFDSLVSYNSNTIEIWEKLLKAGARPSGLVDSGGRSVIVALANSNASDLDKIKLLNLYFQYGGKADDYGQDEIDKNTALYYFIKQQNADAVNLLLEHGADPRAVRWDRNKSQAISASIIAARLGWAEGVKLLE